MAVTGGIWVLTSAGADVWWIPFGALAFANVLSLTFGLVAAGRMTKPVQSPVSFRSVMRSGRWLLLVGLLPTGSAFLAAVLVSRFSSTETLGYAEAARVLGQPILVLALGISASLGPRSMEAA